MMFCGKMNASMDRLTSMNRRVDAHLARTQFGQIMDRAVENNERFVVERRGEPAVDHERAGFYSHRGSPSRLAGEGLEWSEKEGTGQARLA